jgi:hypothetical protein
MVACGGQTEANPDESQAGRPPGPGRAQVPPEGRGEGGAGTGGSEGTTGGAAGTDQGAGETGGTASQASGGSDAGNLPRCEEPRPRCRDWSRSIDAGVLIGDCDTAAGHWTAVCQRDSCTCSLSGITQCACPWASATDGETSCCYITD